MLNITANLDPYALDFPICADSQKRLGRMERHAMKNTIDRANAHRRQKAGSRNLQSYFPSDYEPCTSNWATTYLNRKDVQTAIHAKVGTDWEECNNEINQNYNIADVNRPMMPIYVGLLANKTANLNIMVNCFASYHFAN